MVGCISQPEKIVLDVNPVIDHYPLGGYTEKSEGLFAVLNGSIPEVKEKLNDIVVKKDAVPSAFSVDDDLNLVVFRGVFRTGGYGIDVNSVERKGNEFTVYATYTDPGKGIIVTEAFTQPTAIIPVGKLAAGNYKATLKVTRVVKEERGERVIEENKEYASATFTVK